MFLIKLVTAIHSFVFRLTSGRLLGQIKGMDFCVVKTKGAKSGRTRYIPLMHVPYKKGVILVASMGGADFHPSWYWNIKAHPRLSVCLRGQDIDVLAEQVSDEKKKSCGQYFAPITHRMMIIKKQNGIFLSLIVNQFSSMR